MKKKKLIKLILTGFFIYMLLLLALVLVEPTDSSIMTVFDALWFSLVTISGYGDRFPVSLIGKIISFLFMP